MRVRDGCGGEDSCKEVRAFVHTTPATDACVRRVLPGCTIAPPAVTASPRLRCPWLHADRPAIRRRRPRR